MLCRRRANPYRRGVVFLDLMFAVLIIAVMLHVGLLAAEAGSRRAAALAEKRILLAKTAAYADYLVKYGLAGKEGDAVLQHRLDDEELGRVAEYERRAEEFGLRDVAIETGGIGERYLAEGGGSSENRVCVTRLAMQGGGVVKLVFCAGGLG